VNIFNILDQDDRDTLIVDNNVYYIYGCVNCGFICNLEHDQLCFDCLHCHFIQSDEGDNMDVESSIHSFESDSGSDDSDDTISIDSDSSADSMDSGYTWLSEESMYSCEYTFEERDVIRQNLIQNYIYQHHLDVVQFCDDYMCEYFALRRYSNPFYYDNYDYYNRLRNESIHILTSLQVWAKENGYAGNEWIRDLTRECIESNPGPDLASEMLVLQAKYGYMINIIESSILLAVSLREVKSKTGVVVSVVNFFKATSTSGSLILSSHSVDLVGRVQELVDTHIQSDCDEYMSVLSSLLDNYDNIKESIVYKKVYKFFMYLLSLSAFERFGLSFDNLSYTMIEQESLKKKYYLGVDFYHCILDTIVFLYTRGVQCCKLGSMQPLFHDESVYSKWTLRVYEIRTKSLHLGNPEPHGFTLYDYLGDLRELIDEGRCIYKSLKNSDKGSRAFVGKLLSEVELYMSSAISRREAQKSREAPFSILLYGGSSIAKSTLTQLLFTYFGKVHNLPVDDAYIYTRNPVDEYWVNFNTTQWCVLMDDIAYLNPNKSTNVDKTLSEIIQVVNSTAFVPTQAALEDKGRTPMRAKLVLATTNTKDIMANQYFSCPLAVQRRLPYVVEVVPKDEYLLDGCMIDGSKLPPINEEFPNYWNFKIYKVVPHQLNSPGRTQYADHTLIESFTDINLFLQWFGKTTISFFKVQDKEVNCKQTMRDIKLCNVCLLSMSKCSCSEIQSHETGTVEHYYYSDYCYIILIWLYMNVPWLQQLFFFLLFDRFINVRFNDRPRVLKFYASCLGESQRLRLGGLPMSSVKKIMLIGSLVISIFTVYKILKNKRKVDDVQSTQGQVGFKPVKDKVQIPNVWYKDDFQVTNLDVSRKTLSMKGLPLDQVQCYVKENCVTITSYSLDHDRTWYTKGFCIGGQYYIFNNHSIPEYTNHYIKIITNSSSDGVREHYDVKLYKRMIVRLKEKDLCLIWFPQVRPRRNLLDLFCRESMKGVHKGTLFNRDLNGNIMERKVHNVRLERQNLSDIDVDTLCWTMSASSPTLDGECGSILLSESTVGPILLGIHVALRKDGKLVSIRTTYEDMTYLKGKFDVPIVQSSCINYSSTSSPQELVNVHPKSEVLYVEDGNALVYGSFKGHRAKPKSHVVLTPIARCLMEKGYQLEYGPPCMKGWEPWRNNLIPSLIGGSKIDIDVMSECVEQFSQDILEGLSFEDKCKIVEYDDFTVTNGAAGVRFVDKMNRQTSAGFPFNKSKRNFLNSIPPQHDLQDPVEFNEEIMERVNRCREAYDNLTQYHPVYNTSLKDEPRSFKKILEKNTRGFTGGPVEHIFVTRQELLSYTKVMQENKFVSECAAGTIAQSIEWDNIYRYITFFGKDRCFDGDYEKFDKGMDCTMIIFVFSVIVKVLQGCGASQEHINRVWCICYDLAFAVINFNGTLIQFCKGHVSGEALTVLVNSHANSLYIRYGYYLCNPAKSVRDFKRMLWILTYGDDIFGGVSPKCTFFTFAKLRQKLLEIGIKFTPADKQAGDYDLMAIDNISFLKRKFLFSDELKCYVAPLCKNSIRKSLMVNVASKSVTPEFQIVASISSAVREYFWYGKETFEQEVSFLKDIVKLHPQLEFYIQESTFPTWDSLVNDFHEVNKCIERFDSSEFFKKYS
jgi:hypothetical protein